MQFKPNHYLAFVLSEVSRTLLLQKFQPKFSKVIAHHITLDFCPTQKSIDDYQDMLSLCPIVTVYGYAQGDGVECVAVNCANTSQRLDGKFFHITLSVEPPHKPVESNLLFDQIKLLMSGLLLSGTLELVRK